MEPTFNTSFIPKKSLQADVGGKGNERFTKRRQVYGPGFFLTSIVFAISVLAAVGVFGYTKVVEQSIADKIAEVERIRAEVDDPELTAELARLDLRLTEAENIVANHAAVSSLLREVEAITLKDVQYTEFTYGTVGASWPASTKDGPLITLSIVGVSDTFEHVAVQTDLYRNHEYLSGERINQLEQAEDELVEFQAQMHLNPEMVLFSRALAEGGGSSVIPTPAPAPAPVAVPVDTVSDTEPVTPTESAPAS